MLSGALNLNDKCANIKICLFQTHKENSLFDICLSVHDNEKVNQSNMTPNNKTHYHDDIIPQKNNVLMQT